MHRSWIKSTLSKFGRMVTLCWLGLGFNHVYAAGGDQPLGCLIQADQIVELGSPVIGLLKHVHVDRGDRVRNGQELAALTTDVEQASLGVARTRSETAADLHAAQADRDYNRQRLARAEDLRKQNFISAQALDQNRAEAKISEQKFDQAREQHRIWDRELSLAQAQLSLRVIRSPFDGIVLERYRHPGERVEEKPILRLARLDPLRVEVFMPASRYGSIKPGVSLTVIPDLKGAEPRKAEVVRVDSFIDPASNTFRIQLRLPNSRQVLPAGLRCSINLQELGSAGIHEGSADRQALELQRSTRLGDAAPAAPAAPVRPR